METHITKCSLLVTRVSDQYSKAFIQFSSDGQPGEITFEMRYYGSKFNRNIKFFFFSRVIRVEKMFILTMQFLI